MLVLVSWNRCRQLGSNAGCWQWVGERGGAGAMHAMCWCCCHSQAGGQRGRPDRPAWRGRCAVLDLSRRNRRMNANGGRRHGAASCHVFGSLQVEVQQPSRCARAARHSASQPCRQRSRTRILARLLARAPLPGSGSSIATANFRSISLPCSRVPRREVNAACAASWVRNLAKPNLRLVPAAVQRADSSDHLKQCEACCAQSWAPFLPTATIA